MNDFLVINGKKINRNELKGSKGEQPIQSKHDFDSLKWRELSFEA